MSHTYRVVGALGPSAASPLLAEVVVDAEVVDRVVLDRVRPVEVQRTLRLLGRSSVVAQRRVEKTDRGEWAILPFVSGSDLLQVREAVGAALPIEDTAAILHEVVAILRLAADQGVVHGGLGPGSVRIEPDGRVRILGFRGGSSGNDVRAVQELLEELTTTDAIGPPAAAAAVIDASPDSLQDLAAILTRALGPPPPDAAVRRAALPIATSATLYPHALVGHSIIPEGATRSAPPKVQIAAIGAITLLLGLAAGWALWGWSSDAPEVLVQGATRVQLDCDPWVVGSDRLDASQSRTCRVMARFADGTEAVGDLDGSPLGRYLCVPEDGGLRCTER